METTVAGDKPYKLNLDVRQMLPEPEPAPDPEGAKAVRDKALMERLDNAAKTLVTATAVLIALFAALGLTGDRISVLLNSSSSKYAVVGAAVCAVGAVICGTLAVALPVRLVWLEVVVVVLGTLLFLGSLFLAVVAASSSSTLDGRPTITDVSVADAKGTGANLSFSVSSDGVAQNAALRVVALWVRSSDSEPAPDPFYTAVLRPSAKGAIQQTVTVYLSRQPVDKYVRIQAIRMRDPDNTEDQATAEKALAVVVEAVADANLGTQCNVQTDQRTAPACADVLVPAAAPPPPAEK